jgi:hypothetical protein
MSVQTSLDKLQIRDEKNILIQGLPSSIEKQFSKLSYAKNVTPLLKMRKIDFALIFAINQGQMNAIIKDVYPALHENSKLWVSYPKPTSKIVTDLNRDSSWLQIVDLGFEAIRQVSLDHVWSAIRFRNAAVFTEKKPTLEDLNFDSKLCNTPIELQEIFTERKSAGDFFDSLSLSLKTNYLQWYASSGDDLSDLKITEMVEMLEAGIVNPVEKSFA